MVRTTDFDPAPVTPPAIPLATLDYAPPPPRGTSLRDMVWGIMVSVFLANGVGWSVFGLLMMIGYRDDHAGPVAIGLASVTLGLSLAVMRFLVQPPRHRSR